MVFGWIQESREQLYSLSRMRLLRHIVVSMNINEILIDLARRPQVAAEHLRGRLTSEMLNAHPHHDNSIAWLLWHAAREIDEQLIQLSGQESTWMSQGFEQRFGLDIKPDEHGYGHTAEQARAIIVVDPDLLFAYLNAVIDAQVDHLASLQKNDFSTIVDDRWDPPVTLAARMISMSFDAGEHIGQAAYVAGISPGGFEQHGSDFARQLT